jgi:tellurite methyltransferase
LTCTSKRAVTGKGALGTPARWRAYYAWTASRPPRELLLRTLDHLDWEGRTRRRRLAIELGFGAGTDTLELLRRGWRVLAIDAQDGAARFLARRVPARSRDALTIVVAPMEEVELPPADLVYASFSLPFLPPERFPHVWTHVRRALRPGGHFAGQLFGDEDEWAGHRPMSFFSHPTVRSLARGYRIELLRETVEEGRSFEGPKHWHFFDLILEKPKSRGRSARTR